MFSVLLGTRYFGECLISITNDYTEAHDCPQHQYLHSVSGACTDCPKGMWPTSSQDACEGSAVNAFALAAFVLALLWILSLPPLLYCLYKKLKALPPAPPTASKAPATGNSPSGSPRPSIGSDVEIPSE